MMTLTNPTYTNLIEVNQLSWSDAFTTVVIIDTQLADWETLRDAAPVGSQIILIERGTDGTQVVADALAGKSNIEALHIFSHGKTGSVQLGSSWLDINNLDSNPALINVLKNAMTENGDILIYGCDVAQGEQGQYFVQQLAQLTGADVAASSNLTGSAGLAGDWELEFSTGTIETTTIAVEAFDYVLAAPGDGLYTFKGATKSGNSFVTADKFFVLTAFDGNGGDSLVEADEYGAYINESLINSTGTSYIQVQVADGGSFRLDSAVVGDYHPTSAGVNATDFYDVYVAGYAFGVKVAETAKHSSIGVYQTNYIASRQK